MGKVKQLLEDNQISELEERVSLLLFENEHLMKRIVHLEEKIEHYKQYEEQD